ncbi:hypothetical protein H2198_009545 [Neophaeococcomyces mojaviensis]|uniref:Uncharacterized protein n=1 Tax=Neophaeococcomyces mojaviensis TaxID=3383035 RepID=A0ACC2ZU64_9EURO|nr:hypothetical protein H2198_009545 [Knufia sp. JES_112]
MPSKEYKLTFLGDIMLGRLIDQMLPTHVDEPEEARLAAHFRQSYAHLQNYDATSPWGNTLDFLHKSDLVLGNLETAATTHSTKWPNKVFNYRMHPANVECLKAAGIAYVSLANNHTLGFCREGLFETVKTIEDAKIAHAGAGRTIEEADRPAVLQLPGTKRQIHLYSFSDHPDDWSRVREFNSLRYNEDFRSRIRSILTRSHTGLASKPDLKVFSVHWGPNYSWRPSEDIKSLARFLIDNCGVDIIHGHSSHHVQGVEVYNGKLIIYGCGDFVDDYAVNAEYRNDLSAAWNVHVHMEEDQPIEISKLEVFPNRIKKFQAELIDQKDVDHKWICKKFRALCADLGTVVEEGLGTIGQIVVDLKKQSSNR